MTDPARAAVEAWMYQQCPHEQTRMTVGKHECPDCLLAVGIEVIRWARE